jgi:hypothetical protein
MAFSKFILQLVKQELGIEIVKDQRLSSPEIQRVPISDYLKTTLEEFAPLALAIKTEKWRLNTQPLVNRIQMAEMIFWIKTVDNFFRRK